MTVNGYWQLPNRAGFWRAGGDILERLEGRILLEALGQVLADISEGVAFKTANERRMGESMAADSQ